MSRLVECQRITCRDDQGQEHIIIEYQEMIDASTSSGLEFVTGTKSLRDSDGHACNFLDDDTFLIIQTGHIVRKV